MNSEETKQEGACDCGNCEPQRITLTELSHMVEDGDKEMDYYEKGYYAGLALLLFVIYEILGGIGAVGAVAGFLVYYCHINSNALKPRLDNLKNLMRQGVATVISGPATPGAKPTEEEERNVGGNFL